MFSVRVCVTALLLALIGGLMPESAEAQTRRARRQANAKTPRATARANPLFALQVALDRAGFSPGAIDGRPGQQTTKALRAFQAARGLPAAQPTHPSTRDALGAGQSPLTAYTVSDVDAAGPFIETLPGDMMQQAELPALGYTSVKELLAERFHTSPRVLEQLNPGAKFAAGETVQVPNVEPLAPPQQQGRRPKAESPQTAVTITVDAKARTLTVTGEDDSVRFYAPVSVGSERDPLPTGEFTILSVHYNPVFYYNPALFWDADPSHAKAKVPSGPNNPVGYVWLDLSQEHLGLHGTPEPTSVGSTQSHGCVRLTNWDALRLAAMVPDGTRVVLQ